VAAASNYLENELLDLVLRNSAFAMPPGNFVALATSSFGDDNSGTGELTGGGYARQSVDFANASGGSAANVADLTFTNITGNASTPISHIGIFDAVTGGNLLFHGALTTPKTVPVGEDVVIRAGQLVVALQ
jgi:hypothetical protein